MTEHKESHEHHAHEAHKEPKKIKKTLIWQVIAAVLAIALIVSIYYFKTSGNQGDVSGTLSKEDVKTQMLSFIKDNLVAPGTAVDITSIEEENGMYKINVSVQGQSIESYSTKDGKIFFPQAMNLEQVKKQTEEAKKSQEETAAKEAEGTPKSDKPKVEVFVMSHCPYGTQIEKGLIPVMETLGSKADIQIKFCDYAMHGQKELDEELNQVCISKLFSAKYITYLKCFLKEGNSADCVKEAGIDEAKLSDCIKKIDTEFNVTNNFNDKATWKGNFPTFNVYKTEVVKYSVQGSPTFVLNGVQVNAKRDSASLLATICNAFNEQPEECDTELSSAQPSAGFGFTESAAATGSAADCAS